MPKRRPIAEDLRGASRLVIDATTGTTSVVQQMHHTIASRSPFAWPVQQVSGIVYASIRGVTRAVGAANRSNPVAIVIPCHRVIGADGTLTGYGGGLPRKRWLLEHERRAVGAQLTLELAGKTCRSAPRRAPPQVDPGGKPPARRFAH